MNRPVLGTPLRVEQLALRGAGRSMRLVRTGMGPRRAAAAAARLGGDPVLVAGVGGGLAPQVRPGDVVVASEVRTQLPTTLSLPNSTAGLFSRPSTTLLSSSGRAGLSPTRAARVEVPSAPLLAGALQRLGLTVHTGPVSSVSRIVRAPAAGNSLAVDMESAQLAQLASADVPFAVVRTIVDTIDHPLWRVGTLRRGITALRNLRACQPALEWWAAATGPREVLLAATNRPRAVRTIAGEVDVVLVAGLPHSPDSLRLIEVLQRQRVPTYLVDAVGQIDLRWLAGVTRMGIVSACPHLVEQILHCLGGLGPVRADVAVALPREVS